VIVGPEVGTELLAAGCVGGGVVRLLPDEDELQALSASRTAIPTTANEKRVIPIPRSVAPLGSEGQAMSSTARKESSRDHEPLHAAGRD
jgi:hypothetical protein